MIQVSDGGFLCVPGRAISPWGVIGLNTAYILMTESLLYYQKSFNFQPNSFITRFIPVVFRNKMDEQYVRNKLPFLSFKCAKKKCNLERYGIKFSSISNVFHLKIQTSYWYCIVGKHNRFACRFPWMALNV